MSAPSPSDLLSCAVEAVRAAARHALANEGRRSEATQRTQHDVKLALDQECQVIAEQVIRGAFPGHAILGEEGGAAGEGGDPLWIIDPIDGTVNFSHGLPYWCHSVAVRLGERTLAGAVYAPVYDELYAATADGPATCNDRPLEVSGVPRLQGAMVLTGMEKNFDQHSQSLEVTRAVALAVQKIRLLGAAALDLCQVACGRADAFFESGLHVWDIAAAELIVQRAGGRAEVLCRLGPNKMRYVCSNGRLHTELMELLGRFPGWMRP